MLNANSSRSQWSMIILTLAMFAAFTVSAQGQDVRTVTSGYTHLTGVPEDWSHYHLVFSNPGTEQEAIKSGHYDEWLKVVNDPRYVIQQMRRNAAAQGPSAGDVEARRAEFAARIQGNSAADPQLAYGGAQPRVVGLPARPVKTSKMKPDWSDPLTTSPVLPKTYPRSTALIPSARQAAPMTSWFSRPVRLELAPLYRPLLR